MVNFFDKSNNLDAKKQIAEIGATYVKDGMTVGLGSGSTMAFFVDAITERIRNEKLTIQFVAASKFIENKANNNELKLVSIDQVKKIDYAFDGADKIINKNILIKGGGGSLFREKKILLNASNCFILADESKFVDNLNEYIIPIEIVPFGFTKTIKIIEELEGVCFVRKNNEEYFVTDNHNYIVNVKFTNIKNLQHLHEKIKQINGVIETGIFYDIEFKCITLNTEKY